MPIAREFLGLERPALDSAATWLLGRLRIGTNRRPARFAGRVAQRPGRAAVAGNPGRSLRCGRPSVHAARDHHGGAFSRVLVPGEEAVRRRVDTAAGVGPGAPRDGFVAAEERGEQSAGRGRYGAWVELARLLQALHRELASDALDFGDVVICGQTMPGFDETSAGKRWPSCSGCTCGLWTTWGCGIGRPPAWWRSNTMNVARPARSCWSAPLI